MTGMGQRHGGGGHAQHAVPHGHPGHGHPGHGGHGHPGHGGHGHGHGGGGGGGALFFGGVTAAEVEACSWTAYASTAPNQMLERDPRVAAKAAALKTTLKPGETHYYRFASISGIFSFHLDGGQVQVNRCDDGVTGVGQNYLWDRYPGEIHPDDPAHTSSVGLAGCGCKRTHHPACQYIDSDCFCGILEWNYGPQHEVRCPHNPNYGSTQPHLLAGEGPLGPVGVGQDPLASPPSAFSTTNPDGTTTIGDITYTPPTSGPATQNWDSPPAAGSPLPPLPSSTGSAPMQATVAPPAAPASTSNTGMMVVGLIAAGLGIGGILYLVNERKSQS